LRLGWPHKVCSKKDRTFKIARQIAQRAAATERNLASGFDN
jgi:hypothetical protein